MSHPVRRLVTAVLLALTCVTGLLGVQASTSSATAVGCFANGCTGEGPVSNSCDDDASVWTTESITTAYGPVISQFIYSPACRAFWARGRSINTGEEHGENGNYLIRIVKRRLSDDSLLYKHEATVYGNMAHAYEWTNMAGAGTSPSSKIRACVEWAGNWKCTPWWS